MKKLTTLLVLVSLFSCKEEPFSPTAISTAVTEGWPYQQIKLSFENSGYANFNVKFGTRQIKSYASADGLNVTLPTVTNEEVAPLIVETPGGEVTVVASFKLKPKPTVVYSSSNSFAHRIPLKIVLSDWTYIKSPVADNSYAEYSISNFWGSGYSEFTNDTLRIRNLPEAGTTYQLRLNISNLSYSPNVESEAQYSQLANIPLGSFTYKSSFQKLSTQGKAGDRLSIVFNDTNYFPDQLIVKFLSSPSVEVPLQCKAWDIVGSPGYINAMIGSFEIPMIPAGNYSISVTDPKGITYLAEGVNTFTILP